MPYLFDLDGTITQSNGFGVSRVRIPWPLVWITLKFYHPPTRKEVVDFMKLLKENGETIVIITARPEESRDLTEKYLKKEDVPFDELIFVGPGPERIKRKTDLAEKFEAKRFFDGDREKIKEIRKKGVKASVI